MSFIWRLLGYPTQEQQDLYAQMDARQAPAQEAVQVQAQVVPVPEIQRKRTLVLPSPPQFRLSEEMESLRLAVSNSAPSAREELINEALKKYGPAWVSIALPDQYKEPKARPVKAQAPQPIEVKPVSTIDRSKVVSWALFILSIPLLILGAVLLLTGVMGLSSGVFALPGAAAIGLGSGLLALGCAVFYKSYQ